MHRRKLQDSCIAAAVQRSCTSGSVYGSSGLVAGSTGQHGTMLLLLRVAAAVSLASNAEAMHAAGAAAAAAAHTVWQCLFSEVSLLAIW